MFNKIPDEMGHVQAQIRNQVSLDKASKYILVLNSNMEKGYIPVPQQSPVFVVNYSEAAEISVRDKIHNVAFTSYGIGCLVRFLKIIRFCDIYMIGSDVKLISNKD